MFSFVVDWHYKAKMGKYIPWYSPSTDNRLAIGIGEMRKLLSAPLRRTLPTQMCKVMIEPAHSALVLRRLLVLEHEITLRDLGDTRAKARRCGLGGNTRDS